MNIQEDKNAKAYAKDEFLIHVPVEKIYRVLAEINNWDEWQYAVSESVLFGKLAVGSEFTWKANGIKIKSKIHTVQQNTEIGWTGRMFWITDVHNWWIFKKGESTVVKVEEGVSGFGSSLLKKALAENISKNLVELKIHVEKSKN